MSIFSVFGGGIILLILSFSAPMSVFAKSSLDEGAPIENIVCFKQLHETLNRWETPKEWKASLSTKEFRALRSPTDKVGVWIEMTIGKDFSEAARISATEHLRVRWSKKDCVPQTSLATLNPALKKIAGFTDKHLETLLKKSKDSKGAGIVYVWSPHMNLSHRGAREILSIAEELHLEVTLARDPYSNEKIAKETVKKERLPASALEKLESVELYERGLLLHYPGFIIYKKGKILGTARLGYDDPKTVKKFLAESLK